MGGGELYDREGLGKVYPYMLLILELFKRTRKSQIVRLGEEEVEILGGEL